jgi:hypothetical protein
MDTKEEVIKAISAHSKWKYILRTAIQTGVCESTPERVRQECNCSLGKWLYYRVDENVRSGKLYNEIVDYHAQFHREAGDILELALTGRGAEAELRIERGNRYAKLSAELIKRLSLWQDAM